MKRLALLLTLLACGSCRHAAPPSVPVRAILQIPRTDASFQLNGDLVEPAWQHAAHTGPFHDTRTGALAVPHSEARLLHDGKRLILGLYAADEDIETRAGKPDGPVWTTDAFSLQLRKAGGGPTFLLDISAQGVVTDARLDADGTVHDDWQSGAEVGAEQDGTVNDPRDDDEEWVLEVALPLAAIGAKPGDVLQIRMSRCDTPHGARRRCGAWGGLRSMEGEVALRP